MDTIVEDDLFRTCDVAEAVESSQPSEVFEYVPCKQKFRLRAEEVISLDSIFSGILSLIEPTEKLIQKCTWDIDAKEFLNEKQAIIFEEHLCISKLKDSNCKLSETHKIFLERELQQVGDFKLNIEESYDGYVVSSKSDMNKENSIYKCGHTLTGKYDDKFLIIVEKRMEYDYVNHIKIEKSMEVRNKDDVKLVAKRETKINNESTKFKAEINIKGREDTFVLDGGVLLLMRYLIVNNFVGDYEYYSMNLFGKIIRCLMTVHKERKKIRVFYRIFDHAIRVVNSQYFDDRSEDISETYYTADGHMVLHFWYHFNYLLHSTPAPQKAVEDILPKLELMWRTDKPILDQYKLKKKLTYENAMASLIQRPELADFVSDYLTALLKFKPTDVLHFTIRYFQNMKDRF